MKEEKKKKTEKDYSVVSIVGNKGGIGKSVITFQVAMILAEEYNKKVLLYDGDSQRSLEKILQTKENGIKYESASYKIPDMFQSYVTAEESLEEIENHEIKDYTYKTWHENVDILLNSNLINQVPSKINTLMTMPRQKLLLNWFEANQQELNKYDYIFLDNDASLKTLTHNIMYASDSIVVLTTLDVESLDGVINYVKELIYFYKYKKDLDADKLKGILINRARLRTNIDKFGLNVIRNKEKFEKFKPLVFDNMINEYKIIGEVKLTSELFLQKEHEKAYKQLRNVVKEFFNKGVL